MTFDDLIQHTTFLAVQRYREISSRIRQEILGEREKTLTEVIADIHDEALLLEIEAIAVSD